MTAECLFQDVEKAKEVKVYTDSPMYGATVILGITAGGVASTPQLDELQVKITSLVKKSSAHKIEVIDEAFPEKSGLRIEYPLIEVQDQDMMSQGEP